MNIAIIGAGYVGLVTGACLADLGSTVICMDINEEKIEGLKQGRVPIVESGLDELIERNLKNGRLIFTTDMEQTVNQSYVIMIAVDTPCPDGSGDSDLSKVYAVEDAIVNLMRQDKLVINKSTVPIGTGCAMEARMNKKLAEQGKECRVIVASNPEFLREGTGVYDFMHPDRIVIGFHTEAARKTLERIYMPLIEQGMPAVYVDIPTAESIKFASNVFLALKIAYINEMSRICEKTGANIYDIARGMGMDTRIGRAFLRVGPGFGGSCFPKDTRALVNLAHHNGLTVPVLESIMPSNAMQTQRAVDMIEKAACEKKTKDISLLGLAFKSGTGDTRESPAHAILRMLLKDGYNVIAFDPAAMDETAWVIGEHKSLSYAETAQQAVDRAGVAVLATEWPEFTQLSFNGKSIVDLKNMLQPEAYGDSSYMSL